MKPEPVVHARDSFADAIGEIRVMAVADKWAMCRRPGAIPFTMTVKAIVEETTTERWTRVEKP